MNPEKLFTENEKTSIKNMGISIENRIYTPEECRIMEHIINENIMNESKNNIPELLNNLSNALNILVKFQEG